MSLSGARNASVSGLQAQSASIAVSADNIANSATHGYKAISAKFATLVTTSSGDGSFNSGGVSFTSRALIEKQGLIESTGRVSDLAISGNGFFAVQDSTDDLFLTRAGSFDVNNSGELVNIGGFKLLGWPLDAEERRPGEGGNLNTVASESIDSLEIIDTNAASGTASPTTTIAVRMNLDAGEEAFQGATAEISFFTNGLNEVNSEGEIIVPEEGLNSGDEFTFIANDVGSSFSYGGFSSSRDISKNSVFGVLSSSLPFEEGKNGLTDKDKFTITSNFSGTTTYTYVAGTANTLEGEFNSFDTLADAINFTEGLTARVSDSKVYVSSTNANNALTFSDIAGSELDKKLGFSSIDAGNNRFNTLSGLSSLIQNNSTLGAKINNPSSGASLSIFSLDPLKPLTVEKQQGKAIIDLASSYNGNIGSDDMIVPFGPKMISETGSGNPPSPNISTFDLSIEGGVSESFSYGGFTESFDIGENSIFGASSVFDVFSGSDIEENDILRINDATNDYDFTFVSSNPNVSSGEFNSLNSLTEAINKNASLRSRTEDGKIYISSVDPNLGLSFSNVDGGGGLISTDFITALNISDVSATDPLGNSRFNTLSDLDTLINNIPGMISTLNNTTNNPSIEILAYNGVSQDQLIIGGEESLLSEFSLSSGDVGDGMFRALGIDTIVSETETSGEVEISYEPNSLVKNISSGVISPNFSTNVQVFDSLGSSHNFRMSFLKIGDNKWEMEFYTLNPEEISGREDGQVVSGLIEFNGDGSLKSLGQALTKELSISWLTGASPSSLSLDFGTAGQAAGISNATIVGQTDGIRQFDSEYDVESVVQNGVAAGQFNGINVDKLGVVNALFSNGEVKPIYQLPVVVVPNQNGLKAVTGNVFSITQASGEANLRVAGFGGAGEIVPGSLEGSTADIAEELTNTIGIQSSYNANTTIISTIRDMENELNRRL